MPPPSPPSECTLTSDKLTVLGETLVRAVEARTCVRASPQLDRSHYQTLAESMVQQLGQPATKVRLGFLEGFSLAALLALLLSFVTPLFYFHYVGRQARQDAGLYRENFLHSAVAHILRHARDEAQHAHLEKVLQRPEIRRGISRVIDKHRTLYRHPSHVARRNKCIYANVVLLAIVVGLFCAWRHATPRGMPVLRILICAIAFTMFIIGLEFIFFEYVYMRVQPSNDAHLNHALVCSAAAEFFKAYGETPAHSIECARKTQSACTDVLRSALSDLPT